MKQRGSFSIVTACVVALVGAMVISSAQAGEAGKAVVRSIRGQAQYAEGGNWLQLKEGQILKPGSTVRTMPWMLGVGTNSDSTVLRSNDSVAPSEIWRRR